MTNTPQDTKGSEKCRGGYHFPSGYCRDYHKDKSSQTTPTTEADEPLYEKVEALFDLRVSSSGVDMGIKLSKVHDESMRVWLNGDEWIELRKSIEQLITSQAEAICEEVIGMSFTCEKNHNQRFDWCSYCDVEVTKDELQAKQLQCLTDLLAIRKGGK